MICRACGNESVFEFMDLGQMPLGNAFVKPTDFENEKTFPLKLGFCESCFMVQQTEPPPLESLRKDYESYAYVPFGSTLEKHYAEMGQSIAEDMKLGPDSFVVDIGSNNGLLLSHIRKKSGCRILGIEPAVNISEIARKAGVPTITGFFTHEISDEIIKKHSLADVVTATQVLQHVPNLDQFLSDVYRMLHRTGTLVIEGRYFGDAIQKGSYDTIYHEMIWFFTLSSLENILRRHDFTVVMARLTDIYGGSLRIYAKKGSTRRKDPSATRLLRFEGKSGFKRYAKYKLFAVEASELADKLGRTVKALRGEGKRIAGYGAPSTSATLLSYCKLGSEEISFIVDDSPLKQGFYTPGTHIPILGSKMLDIDRPDYLLLLAWRLRDELLEKVAKHREGGTKVIVPLPEVEIV